MRLRQPDPRPALLLATLRPAPPASQTKIRQDPASALPWSAPTQQSRGMPAHIGQLCSRSANDLGKIRKRDPCGAGTMRLPPISGADPAGPLARALHRRGTDPRGHRPRSVPGAPACGRLSSQVVGQGLGDMPLIPELCFAPRLARPRIPCRAARTGTADPGLSVWCPFFHRQVGRGAAAGAGGCLHEFTPAQQVWPCALVLLPSRQASNGCPAQREIYLRRGERTGNCRQRPGASATVAAHRGTWPFRDQPETCERHATALARPGPVAALPRHPADPS
jgi:hypothetical protein